MFTYTLRRLLIAIPTVLVISLVIFMLLELAPGDPMSDVPLTIPPEVKAKMREALGLDQPSWVRYLLWLKQFMWVEPLHLMDHWFGTAYAADMQRVISWQTRSPVTELIAQRMPQTLWVVGMGYVIGVSIAIPIGVISAYRQYSWFDQLGTFVSMVGFSVPTFFTGVVLIVLFSVNLNWLPSIYDTTLVVDSWEKIVVLLHVLRNSMIPVVTVIALGVPSIFAGAIITEQVFKVNGLGQLLINAIQSNDLPMVQTLTFIFAVLIVSFNLLADVMYGVLDPRIRYD